MGQLQEMPAVRDAVTAGRIGLANAKALAKASGKTDATQVAGDGDLLAKAASMAPEQFQRHANRWAVKRQKDRGESDYRRQRAARYLSIWTDEDDGMTYLKGAFDTITGSKLSDRLDTEVERLRRIDRNSDTAEKRTPGQRFADALDTLTQPRASCSHGRSDGGSGCHENGQQASAAEITIVQHIVPLSDGGPTNIDNLMPVCWACHDKVHHHGWQVVHRRGDELPTLKPPERIRHGPAHAPEIAKGAEPSAFW